MTPATTWSLLRRLATPAAARAGIAVLGLFAGGVCHLLGAAGAGDVLWQITIVLTVAPVTWDVVKGVARGDFGVDIIALLAMVAAFIGGELLAGAIVAVMVTGGDALEDYAAGRARRDLTALLRRAPQVARRRAGDGWDEIAVDAVEAGDVLLVRGGSRSGGGAGGGGGGGGGRAGCSKEGADRGRPGESHLTASARPSCCAWPPRSTSSPRTSWPKASSTMRSRAD